MKTIAIMGAMSEEIEPLLKLIGNYEAEEYANNTYYKAKFNEFDLIIAYSKIGKVNAALTATTMIEKYKAEVLLFSGVAGAVNENLKIGDILYATKLAQHDLDISIFGHPYGFVPGGNVYTKSDERLNLIAKEVAQNEGIKLLGGIIASGDQFIASAEKKAWIKDNFKADAIEMEGGAIGVVCEALDVPFFMLRSISDAAGMDAEFDFDTFLHSSAQTSAKFLYKMIEAIAKKSCG